MRMEVYLKIFCLWILCFGGFLMASECPLTGEIHANSPVVYFGEVINITCAVNQEASLQVLSESPLYFMASKLKADSKDRILKGKPLDSPPNIGITISDIVNQTASKGNKFMHYVCLYDQKEKRCQIGNLYVEIEYRPRDPDPGKCKVYNWERMECKWDLTVEYRQLEGITDVRLEYSLTTESWSPCPALSVINRTLTCVIEETENSPLFVGHYYFHLTVNNTKTLHSATIMPEFHTNSLVKPAKVNSMSAEANRSSIHVKWSVEKEHYPQLFRIRYDITRQNHQWKEESSTGQEVNSTGRDVVLKALLPYRNYTIEINAIPLVQNKPTGFWSDAAIVRNTTLQDVPSDVPNIDPGFYSCVDANCTTVTLYWKRISENSSNGVITKYRIITESNGTRSQPLYIEDPSLTEYNVSVNNKYNTKIKLNVATEVGFSTKSDAFLSVPPLHQGPPYAENIVVEALENKVVNISWATPRIPGDLKTYSITNFSIMWCIGNESGCKGELNYEIFPVKRGKTTHWKTLNITESFEKYAFGISVDAFYRRTGRFISSGIKWSQCPYKVDAVPGDPVKVDLVVEDDQKTSNDTRLFRWNTYSCQKDRVGPIQNFTVIVCSIDSKENCEGTPQVVVLRGNQTEYRVKDLIGGKYYKITVSAGFKGGNSPPGQRKFISPAANEISVNNYSSDKGAEGGVSVGAIAGIVVAVIAAVAVIIIIAWRIRRCLKTPDVEIEMPVIKANGDSKAQESLVTESAPLLPSSEDQCPSPHNKPNGTVQPFNMHDNPYYKSSQSPYYERIGDSQDPSQKSVLYDNSQTAKDSNSSQTVCEHAAANEQGGSTQGPAVCINSGNGHSADIDSYIRPDAMSNGAVVDSSSCERNSLRVHDMSSVQSNATSKSVDEFGYIPN